jgi:O-succinylbenzoate synthase
MCALKLKQIELNEVQLPLKKPFETSFGVTTARRALIVRVEDASGISGFGECTAMELPLFNAETVDTAWEVITRSVVPLISSGKVSEANDVANVLAPIKGNRMAIAAVETAIWDLEAKLNDKPLWKHLGGKLESINCGVSIGIQESPDKLVDVVRTEVESGYQRIKLKIKPGKDIEYVEAVRSAFPEILLSVDANSAYCLENDRSTMLKLEDFNLLMIEQPLAAGDLIDHAKLQRKLKTPICLDESITCLRDARQALEIDACRIINIKLGRVGGHTEARKIQEFALSKGIPVWCGGMLETGIGRAHNIAMSTQEGFTLPGDVSASSRYWANDIIEPPVTVSDSGTITASNNAGLGFDVKLNEMKSLSSRNRVLPF